MKRKRFTKDQIIRILNEAEAGATSAELCRRHAISEQTFHRWKAQYGGLEVNEAGRLETMPIEQAYPRMNGVTLKPGVLVFVTDRDHGNWDYEGTIVSASRSSGTWKFNVEFSGGSFLLDYDQIMVSAENTEEAMEEARVWKAARQLKVFLCHGSENKAVALDMYETLRRADMRPWLDAKDIGPGQDWDTAIRDAVRDSHIVLVLLSRSSVSKTGYVQKEIKFALDRADEQPEGSVYIIPVKLEECAVPRSLAKWQWLNLFEQGAQQRLLSQLRGIATNRFESA